MLSKVAALQEFPLPKTATPFFRHDQFLPQLYRSLCRMLTRGTRRPIDLCEEQRDAFNKRKGLLFYSIVLAHPDPESALSLMVDMSTVAAVTVLH